MQNQSFTLPVTQTSKEKRSDIELIPQGPQTAIIYSIVDLGTQTVQYQNSPPEKKRLIRIGFEYPQYKQLFYVEDTEKKSTVLSRDFPIANPDGYNFLISNRSGIRLFVEAVIGRSLSPDEVKSFNYFDLLGKKVGTLIKHNYSEKHKKSFDNISSFYHVQEGPNTAGLERSLEYQSFFIDPNFENFKSKNFDDLYNFIKEEIKKSEEAILYASKGGTFGLENNGGNISQNFGNQNQGSPQSQENSIPQTGQSFQSQSQHQPQAPIYSDFELKNGVYVLDNSKGTLESLMESGWSVNGLLAKGIVERISPEFAEDGDDVPF